MIYWNLWIILEYCTYDFAVIFCLYGIITLLICWLFELLFFSKRRHFIIYFIYPFWIVPKSNKETVYDVIDVLMLRLMAVKQQ